MKVKIPPRKKNIPAFLCVLKYDRNRATNNIQKEPASERAALNQSGMETNGQMCAVTEN